MKICVNCGAQAKDKSGNYMEESYDHGLYIKTGIIKLLECKQCNKIVDKYIEYERCLVLLDLALQVPSAYRHVIVNCCAGEGGDRINTKFLLKLVFVTLIIDGFCKWQETNEISKQKNLNDEFLVEKMEAIDFIHQEYQFYSQIGVSLVGLFTYVLTAMFICVGHKITRRLLKKSEDKSGWRHVFSGLLLSYCSRSLKLMALLWQPSERSGFMWTSIHLLFFLTTTTNLKVFTKLNVIQAVLTAVCANSTQYFLEWTNFKIL